jgi:glycosyltransferase involved in cell wall biosynthesis
MGLAPVRVLVVTPTYPRFRGDFHGRVIQDLCLRISRLGVDLTVLAPRSRTMAPYDSPFTVRRFAYLPSQRFEVLPERTMKGASMGYLAQLPPYLASAYLSMARERVDVIHSHLTIPLGFMASILPVKAPRLVTCHGSDCTLPIERPLYRPFVRRTLRKADRVVAVSDYVRRLAIMLGANEGGIERIYLGVDVERFKPSDDRRRLRERYGIPPNATVIGTLGRLVSEKRVEDLIVAANEVSGRIDAFFVVGGGGPELGRLKWLAGDLGVENIMFTGEVHEPEIFHKLLDVFVLASVREGLSVSLQEAMASGCVPVAAKACGSPELITEGKNGYFYKPGDAVELADKILKATENPRLGKMARETVVEGFNIDRSAARYVEIYNELALIGSNR